MLGMKVCKVQGHSMAPLYTDGSYLLVSNWLSFLPVRAGQKIVIKHRQFGFIVKTVALVDKNGFIWSKGENGLSLSVEQLGPVDKSQIIGRVFAVFKPTSSIKLQSE